MKEKDFILKYNVELFTISLLVNQAKEKGLKTVTIESPLFRLSYDELGSIGNYLSECGSYNYVAIDFCDRRNAPHPSGIYSEKTLTLEWD